MNNGATITGNTVTGSSGGGIYIDKNGTFTMAGGEISGNTAAKGGGVYIEDGIFIKTGGTITSYASNTTNGNRATEINSGHAIFAYDYYGNPYPTFNIVRHETTAGPGVNLSFNGSSSSYSGAWDEIIRPKGTL
jgi:parallel beta-helix repeat protein